MAEALLLCWTVSLWAMKAISLSDYRDLLMWY